ncbi:hypothetical protein CS022_04985 [Veronia nyctiphanis]|uniref:CBM6 domain-containing protein n=1 Tax=Veronia nyctiphanis TaxID=1278244 RepID=A0A4Q0YXT3_9GAMM|nr:carbohydrate-binding domain-containing protein [Veronia nyctiphanis]RXJ74009.1 hypothetical protein CS022_04985 [Veronia nyctiphanis]
MFSVAVTEVISSTGEDAFEKLDLTSAAVDTTIVDDGNSVVDVSLTQDNASVTEGGTVTYTVELSHVAPAGSKVKIEYEYANAQGEDITEIREASIGPDGKTATFTVQTTDDVLNEASEDFSVRVTEVLTSTGEDAFENISLTGAKLDTTIVDDGLSEVTVTVDGNDTVTEGLATEYTFNLSSPAPEGSKAIIRYTYTDDNGNETSELTEVSVNDSVAVYSLSTTDNYLWQNDKSVSVELVNIVDANGQNTFEKLDVSAASKDVTIAEDAGTAYADTVKVTLSGDETVTEGETASYTVQLDQFAPPGSTVKLSYTYIDAEKNDIVEQATATVGEDGYTATFTINTVDDALRESGDSIVLFEAEDYTSYHDADDRDSGFAFLGSSYRDGPYSGVDVAKTDDGHVVSWIEDGEWLQFDTQLLTGEYRIEVRVSGESDGDIELALGDASVQATFDTDSEDTFQTIDLGKLSLSDDSPDLRVNFADSGFQVDWIRFVPVVEEGSASVFVTEPSQSP